MSDFIQTGGAMEKIATERDKAGRRVLKALGEPNKMEAIVDQINLLIKAVATGKNAEVIVVANKIKEALKG